jgi:hypothetical protein
VIEAWAIDFVEIRITFLVLFAIAVLPLRHVLRLEWNRAAVAAGLLCAAAIGGLTMLPMKTHAVRLDMPRPR